MTRERIDDLIGDIRPDKLRAEVEALLGPRSRIHAPDRLAEVERHLSENLRSLGLDVRQIPFSLKDVEGNKDLGSPEMGDWSKVVYQQLDGRNIVAEKKGRGGGLIVVGAHFDTTQESPGADDNSSSLVALLEVARLVASIDLEPSVLFVAFDMEEIGFHGSRAFVREQLEGRQPTVSIIFESLAYTSSEKGSQKVPPGFGLLYPGEYKKIKRRKYMGDWAGVVYRDSSKNMALTYARFLDQIKADETTVLMRDPSDFPVIGGALRWLVPFARDFGRSDHVAFWERDLPAIMITDTANFRNPHYHRRTDTPDTLDYNHLRDVIAATVLTIEDLFEAV
ncbi:MAG: M28 family peptidase [Rhodospirillum sp.]|nr:M28 family peptidase [Rhodospirillum sp.]